MRKYIFGFGRRTFLIVFISITVILFAAIKTLEIENIQKLSIPKVWYKKTNIDSNPSFVANRDHAETGSKRRLSELQNRGHELLHNRLFRGNFHSLESKQGRVDSTPEVRHIAFLKVHKAASTTIQTILFRFGYRRNLTFVFPKNGHYFSKSSTGHEPLIPPKLNGQYDILCLHGYFNYSIYSSILPRDTVYIAIVRDPWTQFASAFNYYSSLYHFTYLENIPENKMEHLIKYPGVYEEGSLSYTMNSMAKDFGFTTKHYQEVSSNNFNSTRGYLNQLGSIFDFVLIKEHLDESLVILKRRLGWSLKNILYISKNVISPDVQIGEHLMNQFKERNKLDYMVYDYFYKEFQEEMKHHGDSLLAETDNFRKVLVKVQNWCYDQYFGEVVVDATTWNEKFRVTSLDCRLMAKSELGFIRLLKE